MNAMRVRGSFICVWMSELNNVEIGRYRGGKVRLVALDRAAIISDRRPDMRRIYFLLPDVQSGKSIIDELLLKRVEWRHIHVLARPDVHLEQLPEATLTQRSDLLPALARGTAAGGVTGMLPPAGLTIAGGVVVLMTLASAGFGAWTATMIGIGIPSTRLKRFESAIEKGELLMMVDVGKDRVDEIEELVKSHHPEADIEGTDPTIPAFP
jgi:hypothetical protein